jgi:hypothetical protein
MIHRHAARVFPLLVAFVAWSPAVRAQTDWVPLAGPLDAANFPGFMADRMWDDILWKQPIVKGAMRKQGIDPGEGLYAQPGGRSSGPAAARAAGTSTFRPGRRAVLDGLPPALRPQMAQLLPACDRLYATFLSQNLGGGAGQTPSDLALSTTFLLTTAHNLFWGGQAGAPPEAQASHIRYLSAGLRHTLPAGGRLARVTDAPKQLAHDSLVLDACIPILQYAQAKKTGDQGTRQAARRRAAELLAKLGLTPTSMRFRADGSVIVAPARPAAGP